MAIRAEKTTRYLPRFLSIGVLLIASAHGSAATLWEIDSRPGDPIGHGQQFLLDESTGTFGVDSNGAALEVLFDGVDSWRYEFRPATGKTLQPGYYPNASRFATANNPGHGVVKNSGTCFTSGGWFSIYELEYDTNGNVIALALDYDHLCEAGSGQFGKIRINSDVDLGDDNPTASAGEDIVVLENRDVVLDGSLSWVANGTILDYRWTQLGGTAATLSSPDAVITAFTAPDVSPGGDLLRFELLVTTATGKTSADYVDVRVIDGSDELTVIHHESELTDGIGRGVEYYESSADGVFTTYVRERTEQIEIKYDSYTNHAHRHTIDFTPPLGQTWTLGDYRLHGGEVTEANPGFRLAVGGNSCFDHIGRFVIYQLAYGTDQRIQQFAADFDTRCSNDYDGGIRGQIRINSSLPVLSDIPWASAGINASAMENETVTLDAAGSSIGFGQIVAYQWRQVAGPPVQLQDADLAQARFLVPIVDIRGEDMAFEVTVTSDTGKSDTADVSIHVITKSDPISSFSIDSEAGETIGQGQTFTRYGHQWRIHPNYAYSNGIWVDIYQPGQLSGWWDADFVSADSSMFVPGVYENAVGINASTSGRPHISISGDNRACSDANSVNGRYEILDIEYKHGAVDHLLMNFEQRCWSSAPTMFGQLRVNYVDPSVPTAIAGRDVAVDYGDTVAIDGSASVDQGGTIVRYKWQQVAGPSVAIPSPNQPMLEFTAPSALEAGSMPLRLVFELIVADADGFQNWDAVNVTVGGNANPIVEDDEFIVQMNSQGELDVLANDYDPNGNDIDVSRVTLVSAPSEGIASVDTTTGAILYSPATDYYGVDNFSYEIYDNAGLSSDIASATVIVNSPPTANDDNVTTTTGSAVTFSITGNDTDVDGFVDGDTIVIVTAPGNGVVTPVSFGTVTYTPAAGFTGTDTFSYAVNDSHGATSNTATVTVNVTQPPPAPPPKGKGGGGGAPGPLLIGTLLLLTGRRVGAASRTRAQRLSSPGTAGWRD